MLATFFTCENTIDAKKCCYKVGSIHSYKTGDKLSKFWLCRYTLNLKTEWSNVL